MTEGAIKVKYLRVLYFSIANVASKLAGICDSNMFSFIFLFFFRRSNKSIIVNSAEALYYHWIWQLLLKWNASLAHAHRHMFNFLVFHISKSFLMWLSSWIFIFVAPFQRTVQRCAVYEMEKTFHFRFQLKLTFIFMSFVTYIFVTPLNSAAFASFSSAIRMHAVCMWNVNIFQINDKRNVNESERAYQHWKMKQKICCDARYFCENGEGWKWYWRKMDVIVW